MTKATQNEMLQKSRGISERSLGCTRLYFTKYDDGDDEDIVATNDDFTPHKTINFRECQAQRKIIAYFFV